MAKKTTEESGLLEQTSPETTPAGVEEIAPVLLNEPAPERIEPGHPSRDLITPLN